MPGEIDYNSVIADLEARKVLIDETIAKVFWACSPFC
jgi:hypothetical protein